MRRKRLVFRWVVLFCFIAFAILAGGSLLAGRYEAVDRILSAMSPPSGDPAKGQGDPAKELGTATPTAAARVPSTATTDPTARPSSSLATPQAATIDLLFPVNKQNALPASYVPDDLVPLTSVRTINANERLRRPVVPFLEQMLLAAKAAGYELVVSSAYRSYAEQESVHAYWERSLGKVEADRQSAVAGHSEHQLGTVVDLTSVSVAYELDESFGAKPDGRWLRESAHRFGFVISYPAGKEAVTGYAYEPWHVRYVGAEPATAVYQEGTTLEEYLRARR